jgi:hypothetical protein
MIRIVVIEDLSCVEVSRWRIYQFRHPFLCEGQVKNPCVAARRPVAMQKGCELCVLFYL